MMAETSFFFKKILTVFSNSFDIVWVNYLNIFNAASPEQWPHFKPHYARVWLVAGHCRS